MSAEELKIQISHLLPSISYEVGTEWLTLNMEPTEWYDAAKKIRFDEQLFFNYLFCLTCVDWKTHLTMVYHLSSTRHRQTIVIKIKLDQNKPEINTISDIWRTAEFHEREVYEMFGVNFINHPDLRLLILPDGWEGKNPMRKDFEDPVNMIKL